MTHNEQPPAVGRDRGLKGIGGKNSLFNTLNTPNRLTQQDRCDLVAAVRRSRSDSADRETALSQAKCGQVLEFPRRRFFAVRVIDNGDDGWLVLAGPHGWRHGDAASAFIDAHWLARNLGLPIRVRTAA